MPRVVPDQRSKFENEEFFRKLSRECEVRQAGGSEAAARPEWARAEKSLGGAVPRRRGRRARGGAISPGQPSPAASACPYRRRAGRAGAQAARRIWLLISGRLALQIKYTGFRDRPHEERQARFQNACRDGRSEIVSQRARGARGSLVARGRYGPGRFRTVARLPELSGRCLTSYSGFKMRNQTPRVGARGETLSLGPAAVACVGQRSTTSSARTQARLNKGPALFRQRHQGRFRGYL
ncbi:hypothetical protein P7K49_036534 [Saguinus oedipus]|uniref:Uncharacterized protein n=1 Tax=Saguinus oedipus TaxID=9490 RepID=A0ABQ9TKD4_SAGOE|nr:hypothetical protein P7K49_036534 [Saguinus oedipus]